MSTTKGVKIMKVKSKYNLEIKSKEGVTIFIFRKDQIYDAIWEHGDILVRTSLLKMLRFIDIDVFNDNFEILGNA